MEQDPINPELLWRLGIIMEKWRQQRSSDNNLDVVGRLGVLFRRWLEEKYGPEQMNMLINLPQTKLERLTDQTRDFSELVPFGMKLVVAIKQNPADVD